MPLLFILALSLNLYAAPKKELFYEYHGYNLKLNVSDLADRYPEVLHQYAIKDSKKTITLNKDEKEKFYSGMKRGEVVYSVSTNKVRGGGVVPIDKNIQSLRLLLKDDLLRGIEITMGRTPCLSAQKLLFTKYGTPDTRNVAVGSRVWFWMNGRQSIVLDEKLCRIHINWNHDLDDPWAEPKK